MHKTILKACGDIIVWGGLSDSHQHDDLHAHRHAVLALRDQFYTLF